MTQKKHRDRHHSSRLGKLISQARRRRRTHLQHANEGFRFETLEPRQMLAADLEFDLGHAIPAVSQGPVEELAPIVSSLAVAEGEHAGEGEASDDLVAFAQALTDSGTRFFGAGWCPHCKEQKELFQDGADFLPFIEVSNFDNPVTLNAVGRGEDLTLNPSGVPVNSFPTWEFPDGTRLEGTQSLATLSTRSGVPIPTSDTPFIAPIDDGDRNPNDVDEDGDDIVNLLSGSPLHIPLDGYDPGGGPLTYTVTSDNPNLVSSTLLQGNRSMLIDVADWGKINIQLFEQRAPRPTARLIELAESGFYDGVTFHRIVDGFVIQGGDPTATGLGGSQLGDFDDQFHEELQHNRSGTLSFAKSSDDTNDSQFFITEGTTSALRNLDGNHSISGVVVEGEKNREAISSNSTVNPRDVVMTSVEIFTDTENAVVILSAAEGTSGSANITVTATDADGNTFTRAFRVDVVPDTINTLPWLDDIADLTTLAGTTLQTQIQARDVEGNPIMFGVVTPTNFNITVPNSPITPQSPAVADITVTPKAGFTGRENVTFYTYDPAQTDLTGVTVTTFLLSSDSTDFDVQMITVESLGLDLLSASDSGTSDSDNITNVSSMMFAVSGVTPGATVTLRSGNTVIGFGDATGSSIEINTNILVAGGEGVHDITVTTTIGGVESSRTPALSVTFDVTGPTFGSTPPTSAVGGQQLSYDAQTDDETASGASYVRVDPVLGDPLNSEAGDPVIDPATGVFVWTPAAKDIGASAHAIRATDLAGNSTTQTFDLEVLQPPTIRLRLEVTKGGQVISPTNPLLTGDDFQLNAYASDLRLLDDPSEGGVFSAYLDVLYDAGLAMITGTITNGLNFQPSTANEGLSDTPGLIDHAGHFGATLSPVGQGEQLLWTAPFMATSAGSLAFTAESTTDSNDPADDGQSPKFDSGVYGQDNPVCPSSSIQLCLGSFEFLSTTVSIDANFEIVDFTFHPDEDSSANPILVSDVTSNPMGASLNFVGTPEADHGSLVFATGSTTELRYTPDANYFGADEIRFQVSDGSDSLSRAQAIQVISVNDPPNAMDDTTEVDEDAAAAVTIDVLANDEAAPDDASEKDKFLVVSVQTTSDQGGTVAIGSNGRSVTYLPPLNFNGLDTFTYTISDHDTNDPRTDTATVNVTVRDINDPPTATPDTFGDDPAVQGDEANAILEDSVENQLDVLANDSSAPDDGETISLTGQLTQPANGTVSISTDGTMILYTPAPDFFGADTFTYTITDDNAVEPRTAVTTVSLHVAGTNDQPTANNDDMLQVTQNTSNNAFDLLANDTFSPDVGETLTITGVAGVTVGASVTIAADGQSVLYSPAPGFLSSNDGSDTFSYTISDGNGGEDTATATVDVVEFTPSSVSGYVYVDANNNGLREVGERGLAGVSVSITGTSIIGAVSQTIETGTDGSYSFTGLAPLAAGSSYIVMETQPMENFDGDGIPLLDGKDTIGSQGGTVANDMFTIPLAEGVDGVENNFGELKGGTINVVVSPEDTRGLKVTLLADGQEVRDVQATDSMGQTSFVGVVPGDYQIEIAAPFLVTSTQDVVVGGGNTDVVITLDVGKLNVDSIYPTYLDSLSSRSVQYADAAAGPTGLHWLATGPGWATASDVQIAMSADGSTALTITDGSGTVEGTFSPNHALINVLNSLPDGTRRLRLNGSIQEFQSMMSPVDTNMATISIAATSDGDENGPTAGAFTVTQTSAGSTDTTVSYSVSGSADAGTDYSSLTGSVTIPATTTSAIISIPVLDDTTAEGTETVTLTLDAITSGAPGVSIDTANNSGSINILDNDAAGEGEGETIVEAGAILFDFVEQPARFELIRSDNASETRATSAMDHAKMVDLAFSAAEPFAASGEESIEFVTQRNMSADLIAAIDIAFEDEFMADELVDDIL